ncbi:hypothetical protein [Brevundimonas sp.]|uniref:hypothetical protein n=1 Tax=Brevundimonas sp. TaxID=1871086 RepID=UPI00289C0851|nr:hypothetical protein [Brevundimonas sp.]
MRILRIANWFWQSAGTITLFAGWALSFGLPAWAVKASNLFGQYQPASSVLAGFLGALAFGIIARLLAAARESLVSASVRDRFYRDGDRINPLDRLFERQRIAIADIAPPMGSPIIDKTFDTCELIGPANIILAATGAGLMHGNTFTRCDAVSTADGADPQTATAFFNCRFINCHFFNVTLFIHEDVYATANQSIGGLNWITPEPRLSIDQMIEPKSEADTESQAA